jgi:hypothetical protein
MIVRCNQLCKLSDGTTDASLDVDTNNAICNECGEILVGVSKYSKLSMKTTGDILRSKKKKAFVFYCETHDDHVETTFSNSVLIGKSCPDDGKACKINVTKHMVKAIQDFEMLASKESDKDES